MTLDTRGFMDGALRGFETGQRYYQQQRDNERRDTLDERNELRYQDQQARLDERDERADQRYQDERDYRTERDKVADDRYKTESARQQKLTDVQIAQANSAKSLNDYKLSQEKKTAYLSESLPIIQGAAQRFIETGEVDPVFDNEYVKGSAYDPRRYTPRIVQAAFDVEQAMPQVLNGSLSYKDPSFVKSVGTLLERNVKQGIGDTDPQTGKVIKDKQYLRHDFVGDIDPNREGDQPGVVVGLKVTYEDGTTRNAAVTEGRGAGTDQTVKVIPLEQFMQDVTGQISLAKGYFDNDNYARLFNPTDKKSRDEMSKQYRDAVTEIEKDRSEALGLLNSPSEDELKAVNDRFDRRRQVIEQVYGRVNASSGERQTAAAAWAGNDPNKKGFLEAMSAQMDVSNMSPETLEQNYQNAEKLRQAQAAEQKRKEQLARLQSQRDSGGGGTDYDRKNQEYLARSPEWQQNLAEAFSGSLRPPKATSLKEVDYSGYDSNVRPF